MKKTRKTHLLVMDEAKFLCGLGTRTNTARHGYCLITRLGLSHLSRAAREEYLKEMGMCKTCVYVLVNG